MQEQQLVQDDESYQKSVSRTKRSRISEDVYDAYHEQFASQETYQRDRGTHTKTAQAVRRPPPPPPPPVYASQNVGVQMRSPSCTASATER